jgi:AAA+ superfamily predicted ATPase
VIPLPPDAAPPSDHVRRLDQAMRRVYRDLESHVQSLPDQVSPAAAPSGLPGGEDETSKIAALDLLVSWFSLTPFEAAVLVLAAGVELSPGIARLCATADPAAPHPTPALAMRALPDAGLAAFAPDAALRSWRLITLDASPAEGLLQARIRVPDAVLSFLIGQPVLDDHLAALLDSFHPGPLLPSEQALARHLAAVLMGDAGAVVHFVAPPTRQALNIAARAAEILGAALYHLPGYQIPAGPAFVQASRLWQRDQLLVRGMLAISLDSPDIGLEATAVARFASDSGGPVVVIGEAAGDLDRHCHRPVVRLHPVDASHLEIMAAWRGMLGLDPHRAAPRVDALAMRFRLQLSSIASCIAVAAATAATGPEPPSLDETLDRLIPLLREQTRHRLTGLAKRVTADAGDDDLILPETATEALDQIVAHYRNSQQVYDEWGFGGGGSRGLSVLFAGPSGTGKTMAAGVIARRLQLDLVRVDLSQVVDKYIGETEKNLARVFDAASTSDAVLLFDEADTLFGRRSEVRDSRDRAANLQVGFLLQQLETYRGVAVLTSNLPGSMDPAFSRRLAYVIHFTLPDRCQRREIWRRTIPRQISTAALDLDRLARLSLSGGQIRSVSLNAAMIAADREEPLSMRHIALAVRTEFAKQQRIAPLAEMADWPC